MKIVLNSRRNQGQVLVLAAFTTLLVAICLFMTISVSWQVRNRIQLQHAADAKAFSDATMVARAYNSLAYSNRAIAGNIVSMTILHAFHSEISAASDIYKGLMASLGFAIVGETGRWCSCWPGGWCCKFKHFFHMLALVFSEVKVTMAYFSSKVGKRIQKTDKPFRKAIERINDSISYLILFQEMLKMDLLFAGFGDKNPEINKINMTSGQPQNDILAGINTSSDPMEEDFQKKKSELTDIVNAARPGWVRDRYNPAIATAFLSPIFIDKKGPFKSVLDDKWTFGAAVQSPYVDGGSGFYQSAPQNIFPGLRSNIFGHPKSRIQGNHISSFDNWAYFGTIKQGGCTWPALGTTPSLLGMLRPAIVTSNKSGGRHKSPAASLFDWPNKVHEGASHKLEIDDFFDLTVYSTEANADNNYKQPSSYAGFSTEKLSRAFDKTSGKNPWDLKIKVSLPVEGKINLENSTANPESSEAKAVSKAMTYYHHPGNWKEPPNFWNPFWRAKLHPYASDDLIHLSMVGGSDAMLLLLSQ